MDDISDAVKMAVNGAMQYACVHHVTEDRLPGLIRSIHKTIVELSTGIEPVEKADLVPAVPIKKSIFPDYIVCLDDGKKFKSMRRHLLALGMTPEQYREKWGLPGDYSMVCANYSAERSELAKSMGLGKKS